MACKRGQTRGEEHHQRPQPGGAQQGQGGLEHEGGVWLSQVDHGLLVIGHVRVSVDQAGRDWRGCPVGTWHQASRKYFLSVTRIFLFEIVHEST